MTSTRLFCCALMVAVAATAASAGVLDGARRQAEKVSGFQDPEPPPARPAPQIPPARAAEMAVAEAVKELTQEFAEAAKKKEAPARTTSNYFLEKPSAAVTPESVANALTRRLNRDEEVDAYIKWQLLSAVPGKFEQAQVSMALRAYQSAPRLKSMPFMSEQEVAQIREALKSANTQEKASQIEQRIRSARDAVAPQNTMLLHYRQALYAKMPASLETIRAALQDAYERVNAGIGPREIMTEIDAAVRHWALGGVPAGQLRSLGNLLAQLNTAKVNSGAASVYWNADRKTASLRMTPGLNEGRAMQNMISFVEEQLKDPGGGIKMRE